MPKLQKLLRSSFGYASIVSSAVFIALSPALLRAPLPHATSRFHAEPVSLLLIAMRELILVMPAVMAVMTGMAWWALRKGLPSARSRALAASISCLVMSTPFLVADVAIVSYSLAGAVEFTGVLVLFVTLLSIGIAGLVAFRKRSAPLAASVQARVTNGVQGMGTLVPTA
jgi:cytochrome bd-type quinol oxidase subunit 2